jgi:outer membrane protein OmpA-like peptidoglycan-associated protein
MHGVAPIVRCFVNLTLFTRRDSHRSACAALEWPSLLLRTISLWCLLFAASAGAAPADFPVMPGVTVVIAVSNSSGPPQQAQLNDHIAQGDYEVIVKIAAVDSKGISQSAFIDAVDESGERRQVTVPRLVRAEDLANSRLQVLGFLSSDPQVLTGTTALGPSLLITHDLLTKGSAAYSFRNFANRDSISGTLALDAERKPFPVLIDGHRVVLDAILATGQMTAGTATRPFEHYILDNPRHPISLRIAYGPRDGTFPFKPDFAREVVRVDFPVAQSTALDGALAKDCRVEVPGIYFDFDKATLKPQSKPALEEIATIIRKAPSRHISIEGHTDNIGADAYNDDLSKRRAAAVKAALERDYAINGTNVSTQGWGARRPLESNDTLAGRARNRRVELVLDCGQPKSAH